MIATYSRTDLVDQAVAATRDRLRADQATAAAEMSSVRSEIARTEQAVERYLLAFEAGTLTEQACGHRVEALARRLAVLRDRELTMLATAHHDAAASSDDALADLQNRITLAHMTDDLPTCKAVVHKLVETITVHSRDRIVPVYRVPPQTATEPEVRTVEVSGRCRVRTCVG